VRYLPLAAILAVAAVARLTGIHFGLPHLNTRPDEGGIVAIVGGMYHGDFNPHAFNYPALFMLAITAGLLVMTKSGLVMAGSPTAPYRIARYLSAAAGIASVLMLFHIGRRLFGYMTGLAAAALLSLAFLHVRDSHFGVTDVPMTFMVLVTFFFIVRLSESGSTRDLIATGVAAGLATSTKYNAALIALPALAAIFTGATAASGPPAERLRHAGFLLSLMVAAFLFTSPYTLLDFQQFFADFTFESRHLSEGHGVDLGRGWTHHITSTLRYGIGLPMLVAGLAGMALLLSQDRRRGALVALFPVSYYLLLGSGRTVFARYMLPVVPFLCLTAAYFVAQAADWLAARLRRPRLAPLLLTAGVVGLLWPSARSVMAFDQLMTLEDSRLIARRWIERHFPGGTTIGQLGPEGGRPFLFNQLEVPYVNQPLTWRRARHPDLVIVQTSPLMPMARELVGLEGILERDYELGFARDVVGNHPSNIYDWQDEFFLPLAGFKDIERPGPNFRIYIRRGSFLELPRGLNSDLYPPGHRQ
jgi:hypothetical protein